MASRKRKSVRKSAATAVTIPGTISLQGPLPITSAAQTWEYFVYEVPMNATVAQIQARCTQLGRDGWELAAPLFGTGLSGQGAPVVFKRPV